ncbi:MAG: phosphatidylserine decarboxylase [Firmicutes bacterium]|nr:phosphatidylserine decarboxylase [Bacillota bacterium]
MAKTSFSTWFLYRTLPGRFLLKFLTRPALSRAAGSFLSSRLSRFLVPFYVKACHLDLSLCETTDFQTFNDCFTRKYRSEVRPIDPDPAALICPCDGLLSVYPIQDHTVLPVKQSLYTIPDLLGDPALAEAFEGGLCLVFRLQVTDYHRYFYPDSGRVLLHKKIPGLLHTVRPIALRNIPVFTENAREITLLDTDHFGRICQIEVGALMVGRIENDLPENPAGFSFSRGQEKGRFLFGGSTIILLLQKGQAKIKTGLLARSGRGLETPVQFGEKIN